MNQSIESTKELKDSTSISSSKKTQFQDPTSVFLVEVTEKLKRGESLNSKETLFIQNIKSNDIHGMLGWNLFYELIKNSDEQKAGYWTSSHLATQMMLPKILLLKQKYDTGRVKIDEYDFIIDMQTEIREYIPGYNSEKSQFAHYLRPILEHVAYTYNRDTTPYLMERNNFVVDSYDKRLEEGTYVPKDYNLLDPEESLIEKEHNDLFSNLLSLSGIEYDGSKFKEIDTDQIQNFVILQKFMGGLSYLKEIDSNFIQNFARALNNKKGYQTPVLIEKEEDDILEEMEGELNYGE